MSIPPLFTGLFDDAALFPPGNAPMPDAVRGHACYRQDWYAGLVARFVCPAGRLAELDAALATAALSAPEVAAAGSEISLTIPSGPAGLAAALAVAEGLPRLRIGAVELPVTAAELPAALDELSRTAHGGITVFAELPVAQVSRELASTLRQAGLALKLRTGGATAAAFPDPATLAGAIEAAVAGGVRFKCTAGLHNAVAHLDPATGWSHHGFLNVLLAVHAAGTGAAAAELLASQDAAELAEQVRRLSPVEVTALRARFASIGSCSIIEPLTDLTELRLVSPA